jgi:hypothetical protein
MKNPKDGGRHALDIYKNQNPKALIVAITSLQEHQTFRLL